jgi:putative membrane protein
MAIPFLKLRRPSFRKGLIAGAIGGLAGGLTKAAAEAMYPPRLLGEISPPVLLVERIAGLPLAPREQKVAETCVHFAFSAGIGALYGVIAEYWPDATAARGGAFALALLALTHESALPLLHLAESPQRQPKQEQSSELLTHLVFGLTVEQLRRRIRPLL